MLCWDEISPSGVAVYTTNHLQEAGMSDSIEARGLRADSDVVKSGLFKEITMYSTKAFLTPKNHRSRTTCFRATYPDLHRIEVLFKVRALLGFYILHGIPTVAICRRDLAKRFAAFTTIADNKREL